MGATYQFDRKDIEFNAEGNILRGWLYLPKVNGNPPPIIVMAHGFGAVKEMHLDKFAEQFASHGMAALVFDYRGLGESEGPIRNEVNPLEQIEDYRHAVTFISTLDGIEKDRIGAWGTSYSGGHVLVLAATDPRIKCVVSQVPAISGSQSASRRVPPHLVKNLTDTFAEDRILRMKGEHPTMRKIVSNNPEDKVVFSMPDAIEWYLESGRISPHWKNEVTLRSVEMSRYYEPGTYISQISPTPLLMIVANEDHITPTDLALKAYENALEPKELRIFSGGHFDPYVKEFKLASEEAVQWFLKHL